MADPSPTSSSHENSALTSSSNDNTNSPKRLMRKKALSIAVQYRSASKQWPSKKWLKLKNVHKDLAVVRKFLTTKYGYDDADIETLADDSDAEESNPKRLPTKTNIYNAIDALLQDVGNGDHLVFHFSGHGSQQPAGIDSDETDGLDELFWPCDVELEHDEISQELYAVRGYMLDDELKRRLVDNLPEGVRLTVIFDSCHSGTGLDLPHSRISSLPSSPIMGSQTFWAEPSYPSHDNPSGQVYGKGIKMLIRGQKGKARIGSINLTYDAQIQENGESNIEIVKSRPHIDVSRRKPRRNDHSRLITSWAACSDDQLEYELLDGYGGAFVNILSQILLDANTIAPTRREVLNKLTKGLHENSKEIRRKITLKINLARREGDERKANKLQQHLDDHRDSTSKPVFSSLVNPDEILDELFVL